MRLRLSILAAALLVLAMIAAPARGAVYWANSNWLGIANADGGESSWLPHGYLPAPETKGGCGLDVDAQHLYWGEARSGAIGRGLLDASQSNQAFITGLGAPCGVAVGGSHIYWSDLETNLIGRANLDGSGVEPAFIAGADRPCGIAVDGTHVYWANALGGAIGRANLDGSGVEQQFISGLENPCGVAVGGGYVFWGDQGLKSIGRAGTDGADVLPQLVAGAGEPWDVAVDGSHVFWADRWGTPADPNGGIGRAGLDGGAVIHDLIPGIGNPSGVAVDGRTLGSSPPAPLPSEYLRFGRLRHRADGGLELFLFVPARGDLEVTGPRIGWRIEKGNPPPVVGGAFRWTLQLWPGKRGAAARRIHRQLQRTGRAEVMVRVSYIQEGRTPLVSTKRVVFRR